MRREEVNRVLAIRKVIIPAAGLGTRLFPAPQKRTKPVTS